MIHFPYNMNISEYISVGSNPQGISYDPISGRIAVCLVGDKKVVIYDSGFNVVAEISVPTTPVGIEYDDINNRWFVLDDDILSDDDRVFVIDGVDYSISPDKTEIANNNTSRAIVFDHATDRVFISSFTNSTILVHKISDFSYITTMNVSSAIGLHLDVPNNRLWVGCHAERVVRVYDATTYALTKTVSGITGDVKFSQSYFLRVDDQNPDLLLSSDPAEKTIVAIKKSTGVVLGKMNLGSAPIYFFPLGSKIYASLNSANKIAVIDKFYI